MNNKEIFENLFVLELANNHWGDLDRGLRIIREHGKVVKKNGVKAAVKFQFRDPKNFVHKDYQKIKMDKEALSAPGSNTRYVKKTLSTILSEEDYAKLFDEVRNWGMLVMSTPFDEESVDMCDRLNVDIMKIGSMDTKSWTLIEKIADLGKPTIISIGGTDIEDFEKVANFFREKEIPLAVNHCVSLYPSEDHELNLNQIDYLRRKYPDYVIGFSTHEYNDWHSSMLMSYAKGARTWERHIDIDADGIPVSKYCSLPNQCDAWFKAFHKACEMCGDTNHDRQREIPQKERDYVRSVSRGMYAKRDLKAGSIISKENLNEDFYFAIPALDNQYTSRDIDEGIILKEDVEKDKPIFR